MHAGDGALPRGVDVHHDEHIGLVEGGEELAAQVQRARVAVGLEYRDDAPVESRLGGGEGGADLGGMMPVVVDDEDAPRLAADLEAALDAREGGEGSLD